MDRPKQKRESGGRKCFICRLPAVGRESFTFAYLCASHYGQAKKLQLQLIAARETPMKRPKCGQDGRRLKPHTDIREPRRAVFHGGRFDNRGSASA